MLTQSGWKRIVVLAFPQSVVKASHLTATETHRFILDDTSEAALQKSLAKIRQEHGAIGLFLHLHPLFCADLTLSTAFNEAEKQVLKTVFFLAKHLKQDLAQSEPGVRNCFITLTRLNGKLGFGTPPGSSILAGGLFGLIKTIAIEWGSVFCRAIDVDPRLDNAAILELLPRELEDADTRVLEVGCSATGRVTLTATVDSLPVAIPAAPDLNAEAVFLVSGGAKGVTATCIKTLAANFHPRFILVGRSAYADTEPEWCQGIVAESELKKRCMEQFRSAGEKPTPVKINARLKPILAQREIRQTLTALRESGSQAEYLSVDLLDTATLQQKLQPLTAAWGEITGIIHGAGVLADKLITEKTEKDYQAVVSTKIDGLQSLLQCVSPEKLRHLVLFSSAAGFFGNEAQSDYATANEILNKFAQLFKHKHPSCHVIAFNWGPWDGGMVTPSLKRLFEERNIKVIPPAVGSAIMTNEMALNDKSVTQVVIGSSLVVPRKRSATLQSYQSARHLSLAANPFLRDHIIGNDSVLPIICALAWMAETCEQLSPGYRLIACEEIKVLKGIVFDASLAGEYQVHVSELEAPTPQERTFKVDVSSAGKQKPVFHYSSRIMLSSALRKADAGFTAMELDPRQTQNGHGFYTDGTLFHGPLLQLVQKQINLDDERLTLLCQAPGISPTGQGQFRVGSFNPFADDALLQALLIWVRQRFHSASLPLGIAKAEFFKPIPFDQPYYVSLRVKSASPSKLVADIAAHDENGQLFSQITGAEAIISKALDRKFKK